MGLLIIITSLAALWNKAESLGSGLFRVSLPASTKAAILYWPFLNLLCLINIAVLFLCGRLPQQTNLRLASVSHLFRSSSHFLVSLDLNHIFTRRLFIGRSNLKTLETLPA